MAFEHFINDELMCARAAAGDLEQEALLVQKYNFLVKACARPYFLVGGDSEDLIQEGLLGLLAAIRTFDPNRDTSFKTFAESCIRNRLFNAIKLASRAKHAPLNDSVSFESQQFAESQNRLVLNMRNPEDLVIGKEQMEEMLRRITGSLSRLEASVLSLYLEGLSYQEIGQSLNRPVKSVDNAVQRIRKKLADVDLSDNSK